MNRLAKILAAFLFCLWMAATSLSQEQGARPPITGVARVQIYVTDAAKSKVYYEQALGFAAETADCSKDLVVCLVANNHQEIQLVQVAGQRPRQPYRQGGFLHAGCGSRCAAICYSKGLTPNPISVSPGHAQHFTVQDPEGHAVSFIQLAGLKARAERRESSQHKPDSCGIHRARPAGGGSLLQRYSRISSLLAGRHERQRDQLGEHAGAGWNRLD